MGYYTNHKLVAKNLTRDEFEEIDQILKDKRIVGPAFSGCALQEGEYIDDEMYAIWWTGDRAKWYESDDDIKEIAAMFPCAKFNLMCVGEDDSEWADFFYKDMHDYVRRPDFIPKPVSFEW